MQGAGGWGLKCWLAESVATSGAGQKQQGPTTTRRPPPNLSIIPKDGAKKHVISCQVGFVLLLGRAEGGGGREWMIRDGERQGWGFGRPLDDGGWRVSRG